jgi:hypothetical protein
MGVYSLSEDSPKKVANFDFANREFEGAAKYSDWKFVYNLGAQQQTSGTNPGTQQAPIQQQTPAPGTQQVPFPQQSPAPGTM